MNNRIKVLHLKVSLSSDGATAIVLNWAKHLKDEVQFDWLIYSKEGNDWQYKFEQLGSQIFCIEDEKKKFKAPFRTAKSVINFLKEKNYDIIHIDTDDLNRVNILFYAMLAGVPCRIMHSHNSDGNRNGLLSSRVIRKLMRYCIGLFATEYVACSKAAAQWMFPKKKLNQVKILNNGIDSLKFKFSNEKRKKIRDELGLEGNYVIGNIGRFSEQKNHAFLINVIKKVYDADKSIRLVLIGAGELEENIKRQISELELDGVVQLLGVRDNVEDYLCAMDLFVLPSVWEGLGIVNIEAQANGLFCLVSDQVAREAKISDNIKFLRLNEEIWYENIILLRNTNNEIERDKMWYAAKKNNYDIKDSSKELLEIYSNSV